MKPVTLKIRVMKERHHKLGAKLLVYQTSTATKPPDEEHQKKSLQFKNDDVARPNESVLSHEVEQTMQGPRDCQSSEPARTHSMSDSDTPLRSPSLSSLGYTAEPPSACTTISQGESEVSGSSMNEGSEDSHGEEESTFIQRAERRRTLLQDLMGMVYSTYTSLAASGTMEDGESSSSAPTQGDSNNNTGDCPNGQQNRRYDPKGKRPLTLDDENNDQEEDDERQQPKRIKSAADKDGLNPARKLACPYYQRNRHRRHANVNLPRGACYGPGFLSVHRVKEHLYRAHRLPLCCPRCDATFDSDVSLEMHARQDPPCEIVTKRPREGINSTTEKLLRSRNKEFNGKTEEEKWKHVYIVLFPADNPRDLPSPYHESQIEADFTKDSPNPKSTAKRYEEFLRRELFQRIYRVLENKIDEALDLAERDVADTLKDQLQGIFRDVQTELYEEFQASITLENEEGRDGPTENAPEIPTPMPELDTWTQSHFYGPWSALELDRLAATRASVPSIPNELEDLTSFGLDFDLVPGPATAEHNHDFGAVPAVPFKVKAIYEYLSTNEDDLPFRTDQIITVTNEEGAGWYSGEYVDDFGIKKEGIFPQSFVEKYKPIIPPRPIRRHKDGQPDATTFPPFSLLPSCYPA
ncbi:hypothetical protein F4677DRAFT_441889 [Hypoxylon crocopeplum]|nr:hypothetical protein F4677DRAFT_441889 [Hypoxylon crocopeplum]